jgi:hypothetical protein
MTRAPDGSPPAVTSSNQLRTVAASSCGITMKMLKMPMFTPIFRDDRLFASIA